MKYNRIMPGAKSVHLDECFNGDFIGVDFGINEDISNYLSDDVKSFKERYRKIYLENRPDKSKVAAGLACGSIWTVCYNLKKGDILWTSTNSFVASSNCGLLCGAKVDFIDIDLENYNLSIEKLEKKLIQAKKKISYQKF